MPLQPGTYGNHNLSGEQLNNAEVIADVGYSLGASDRDVMIALMTAMQESTLRNLNYGDRDSLGLFQQRTPWGPASARTNPADSARMFFTGGQGGQPGLFSIKTRDSMAPTVAAQQVQRSAFPSAYAKHQPMAEAVVSAIGGNPNPQGFLPGLPGGDGIGSVLAPITEFVDFVTNPRNWFRFAIFMMGVGAVVMGVILLIGTQTLGDALKKTIGRANGGNRGNDSDTSPSDGTENVGMDGGSDSSGS